MAADIRQSGDGVETVEDEGTIVGVAPDTINFVGGGVAVTEDPSDPTIAIVTISGAAAGTVIGPGSATDNAVARFDLTSGAIIQNSTVTISDAGSISLVALQTVDGRDVSVDGASLDTIAAAYVASTRTLTAGAGLTGGGSLAADRTFDVVANADGSVTVNANDIQVGILASDAQHGVRGGGTQHAAAIDGGASGFMTGAQVTKLAGITAGAAVSSVTAGAGSVNNGTATAPIIDIVAGDTSIVVGANSLALGTTIPTIATFSGAGTALSVTNNFAVGGVISNATGSAAAPSYTITGDLDTGMYGIAGDSLGFATGGSLRLGVSTSALTSTLPYLGSAGSNSAPSLSFSSDTNTGIYSVGADDVGIATNGTLRFDVSTTLVTSTLPVVHPVGAVGAPSITFAGQTTDGFYSPASGQLAIALTGVQRLLWTTNTLSSSPMAATTGTPTSWTFTQPAHTGLTASTENTSFNLNTSATKQFATGALTTQREVRIQAPTYAFVGASTITTAVTLDIGGAPITGANATLTNSYSLRTFGMVQFANAAGDGGFSMVDATTDHLLSANGATTRLLIRGNMAAANSGTDVQVRTVATRTAGNLFAACNLTSQRFIVDFSGGITLTGSAVTTGQGVIISSTPGTWTGQTAGSDISGVFFETASITHAGSTNQSTNRDFRIRQRTHAFAGGAATITDCATIGVEGGPVQGTNATFTRSLALWLQADGFRHDGQLFLSSIISPTQLTGNQNDYAPASFSTCFAIRQDVDATGRTITGLAGGAVGRVVCILNIATGVTNIITLTNEDAASTAANRFALPNSASILIRPNGSLMLWYDTTSSRWRAVSQF